MPHPTNRLSSVEVRNLKPESRTYRKRDGGGMYLEVTPSGGKYWRMKYRLHGKEKRLAIGIFPEVSLADARAAREEARRQIAQGIDPSAAKRIARQQNAAAAANTLELVGREWFERIHKPNVVEDHSSHNISRLENHAFSVLGKRPIGEITVPEVLDCLRRIERQGKLETAKRVQTLLSQIFRYAIQTGRAERDPCADLKGALSPPKVRHHPAITEPEEVGALMRAIYAYQGEPVTMAALKLTALVFVRPGELRRAEWQAIDLEAATWSFEASKNGPPLVVPLSSQALAILRELHPLTGRGRYVFPGARSASRPMSENAVTGALAGMGYKGRMTAHGFRAMARTLLDERLGYLPQYIEQQLAHSVRDANGRAYNRTSHLAQRREMLQAWADYLDELRDGTTNVIPMRSA